MRNIDPILDRLKHVVNAKTDRELCDKIKMSYATLDTWKNRDKIPLQKLRIIALSKGINHIWLETGEGEMVDSKSQSFTMGNVSSGASVNQGHGNLITSEPNSESHVVEQTLLAYFRRATDKQKDDIMFKIMEILRNG